MFHASMGRFQLELYYYITYFSNVFPSNRPVENVVLTTKGLKERNTQLLDGTSVKK